MVDFTKTDKFLTLEASKERKIRSIGKHSDTGVSPAKENKTNWIDGYFSNLTCRVAKETDIIYPRSEIKQPSINLQSSLKMFLQEAACDADNWTDVNCRYGDRRSFPALLSEISLSGLDKYASKEDNDISIGYQTNTWSFSKTSLDDVVNLMKIPPRIRIDSARNLNLMLMKPSQTDTMVDKYNGGSLYSRMIEKDPCHDIAWSYYKECLSFRELSRRICLECGDDFRREQAGLLESFLDHLIKIQQEQRFVASSFFEHLGQLQESACSPYTVDDYGDIMCPLILPKHKHTMQSYIWGQKHIFDSLCTMSRESVWLLKTLKDSYFSSPSSIKESNKILDIISAFIPKFKKSKVLLDQYLYDESFGSYVDPNKLVTYTKEKLDAFGERVKHLQEQGVERKSVTETLLGCFLDVVDMSCKLGKPSEDTCSSLKFQFSEAVKETLELINEALEKIYSVKFSDLTSGGSPLGCIALWRIIFESSLINLRLDLICKRVNRVADDQMDEITPSIDELLVAGEGFLGAFIRMHETVAEVTFRLGDAFTTGGDGRRIDPEDFNLDDFPWDKHNLSPRIENTMNWTDCGEEDDG